MNNVTIDQQDGGLFRGESLQIFTLQNDNVRIRITNSGCIILSIEVPDKNGIQKNIVAGFKTIGEYKNNKDFFGCVVGRFANRIANGRFKIGEEIYQLSLNDGVNHLHGGYNGFDKKIWTVADIIQAETEAGIVFSYTSEDGEEGYPGNLTVWTTYVLNSKNELIIHYRAVTDKPTPVNLTNHSYFNLTGFENSSVLDHVLTIHSDEYTEKNDHNQPTGRFVSVTDSIFDFRMGKKLGEDINNETLQDDRGYNHNFVLKRSNSDQLIPAATLVDEESGRRLDVFTTAPGMQLYTANFWDGSINGAQHKNYNQHSAVALETQLFPDSPNHPHFPNSILYPGEEYYSTTIYAFGFTS